MPVAFRKVRFWRVVEAVAKILDKVTRPVFEIEKSVVVAKAVEEAIEKSVVFVSPLFA